MCHYKYKDTYILFLICCLHITEYLGNVDIAIAILLRVGHLCVYFPLLFWGQKRPLEVGQSHQPKPLVLGVPAVPVVFPGSSGVHANPERPKIE